MRYAVLLFLCTTLHSLRLVCSFVLLQQLVQAGKNWGHLS